jgi:hypothetical protein
MTALVLIEKIGEQKYRASTAQPIAMAAEGRSRDEAVEHLSTLVRERLARGELVQIPLPGTARDNPWIAFAGIWKDHPDWDAFRKNIAEYRRNTDCALPKPG